jgi:hypothetical protein
MAVLSGEGLETAKKRCRLCLFYGAGIIHTANNLFLFLSKSIQNWPYSRASVDDIMDLDRS